MRRETGLPEAIWILAGLAVLVASALQTATGAGLGLIAGPILLFAMGSNAAIHVAVLLNLALSLALLPSERAELPFAPLTWLSVGAFFGLPLGALALSLAPISALELAAGLAVTLGGVQMLVALRQAPPPRTGGNRSAGVIGFGLLAGMMTAALAIPGPAAIWGLARTTLSATQVRAVLRAFFVLAYSFTLAIHAALGMPWGEILLATGWMLPSLIAGAAAGIFIKGRVSELTLRRAFLVMLLSMGIALLINSAIRFSG